MSAQIRSLAEYDRNSMMIDSGAPTAKMARGTGQFREMRLFLPDSVEALAEATDSQGEQLRFRILNLSAFGCRLSAGDSHSRLHLNQGLQKLSLRISGQEVYSGPATVMNESASGEIPNYGIALQGYGLDTERVRAILNVRDSSEHLSGTRNVLAIASLVRPEFKIQCSHLAAVFQDLRSRLHDEEEKIRGADVTDSYRRKLETQAIDMAMALYQHDIHRIFDEFHTLVDSLLPEERIIHKRFFRAIFHPLLLGAPFIQRAFKKPLGYAGDYGLMVMFYEYEDLGSSLFDKFMHRFACNEPAAVANKNRVTYLSERLLSAYEQHCQTAPKKTPFKVSSIACGPAREMELFIQQVKLNPEHPIHIVLVDQEIKALEHAQVKLRRLGHPLDQLKITLLAEDAVLGIIKGSPFTSHLKNCNVTLSSGLFDYLSDRIAEKLIHSLYETLTSSGTLFIGNVSRQNPDRFSMEFLMDWQLILRSEDDLKRLCKTEWVSHRQVDVVSEVLGLNLFLEVRRPE